ncbi:hypothetical protein KJ785_04160 [Patescibacteria group bacterium]|nr:hypothetical protein [Patescibacteria group bacterium]
MQTTTYGNKAEGNSRFVIIAPHGAGDDLKTGIIAYRLAKKLNAFLVINNKFIKPNNKRAKDNPDQVEDFNKLRWSYPRSKYLWKKKRPEMKTFFEDIDFFCKQAKEFSPDKKAVAIYIHGIKSEKVGIDIGAGLKKHNDSASKVFGTKKHKDMRDNTGRVTMKIGTLKKIKKQLTEKIKEDSGLNIAVGNRYSGWSKQSAIQFHKLESRDDYALQFEISHLFRQDDEKINYIVNLLGEVLDNNF